MAIPTATSLGYIQYMKCNQTEIMYNVLFFNKFRPPNTIIRLEFFCGLLKHTQASQMLYLRFTLVQSDNFFYYELELTQSAQSIPATACKHQQNATLAGSGGIL